MTDDINRILKLTAIAFGCLLVVAFAIAIAATAAYRAGITHGDTRVRSEWNEKLADEAREGEAIRTDAERDLAAEPPASLRNHIEQDLWNRDGWKDGKRP